MIGIEEQIAEIQKTINLLIKKKNFFMQENIQTADTSLKFNQKNELENIEKQLQENRQELEKLEVQKRLDEEEMSLKEKIQVLEKEQEEYKSLITELNSQKHKSESESIKNKIHELEKQQEKNQKLIANLRLENQKLKSRFTQKQENKSDKISSSKVKTFTVNGVSFDMIFVEGNDKIDDFWIGKYPVTQELYYAVTGLNPSEFENCPTCPVENITTYNIENFIKPLNKITNQNFQIPDIEQWMYAANGGKYFRNYRYSGSHDIKKVAWYEDNSENKTHPVGELTPNQLGLYDMSGNVDEVCTNLSNIEDNASVIDISASNAAYIATLIIIISLSSTGYLWFIENWSIISSFLISIFTGAIIFMGVLRILWTTTSKAKLPEYVMMGGSIDTSSINCETNFVGKYTERKCVGFRLCLPK